MNRICKAVTVKLSTFLLLLAALLLFSGAARAGDEFVNEQGYLLNLKNVDISILLDLYSRLTGKAVLPSSEIRGTVNVINKGRVSKRQALAIIESVLELHGYSTVPSGEIIKVVAKKNAVKRNILTERVGPSASIHPSDRVETHLVVLRSIKAENAKAIVRPLLSDVGNVTVDKASNTLVLTEVASNSSRLVRILRSLDHSPAKSRSVLKSHRIYNAPVEDVTRQLERYFRNKYGGEGLPMPSFIADKRLRAVVVTATPAAHKEVERALGVFDKPSGLAGRENLVIHLEYANAMNVAAILTKLFRKEPKEDTGEADKRKKEGQIGKKEQSPFKVVADEATNTVIVSTERSRFREIREIVKSLDVRNKQVLVKAIIYGSDSAVGLEPRGQLAVRGGQGSDAVEYGEPPYDRHAFFRSSERGRGYKIRFFQA